MARKAKIDNSKLKRFARKETSRKQDFRAKRRFFLIVCEGAKTEPNYFRGLEKNLPPGVVNTIELAIEGEGHNTLTVIQDAINAKKRLENQGRIIDEVWTVFDRDSFPDQNFNNAIFKGQALGVHCAWTNEAFELWYLLHFQFFQNGMSRTDYKAVIERELSQRIGQPYNYEKNNKDMFTLLQKYGDIKQAMARAKNLEAVFAGRTDYANHNPCTKVYELLEKLGF
ncbi:RloB family protein [Spirosoma validum]|uniref:RloB domain-containing protein n=1 Tax=Spirosoma validum TaxID=2771355 RepID=A0A927B5C2_9BACT|nr:RloB family protein [Spirosoma validum]MBD2755487.1 RloB domain-containing protein [Spirosoma validum]